MKTKSHSLTQESQTDKMKTHNIQATKPEFTTVAVSLFNSCTLSLKYIMIIHSGSQKQ